MSRYWSLKIQIMKFYLVASKAFLRRYFLSKIKAVKLCFAMLKVLLFVLCCFMFLPLAIFIGRAEYVAGILKVLEGYIEDLYQSGLIDKEEKKELEDNLNS